VWYRSITPVYQTGNAGALPAIRSNNGYIMSITVVVKNNNVEKAIRQLKKKLMREGVVKELKTRQYYEKPSEKKLRLKKENIKRVLKNKKIREREQ
tara:strand:- start:125 stop:412 length:288 start_codon:yes stop_codon:yes gene_type:complete